METPPFSAAADDPTALWDWDNLLEFAINPDDHGDPLLLPWPGSGSDDHRSPPPPPPPQSAAEVTPVPSPSETKVRKRDPRLICPNYLAGRVPCSCPELDEKAVEEEEAAEIAAGARKRVRKSGAAAEVRCQVPGCEADIRELKGYHRRHRVCLRCANASCVLLDGVQKRYCQQCGKFHILPDFDEGKRSCRRKLEKHNKRRRRRPDSRGVVEKELEDPVDLLADLTCGGQPSGETSNGVGSDIVETVVSNKSLDKETPIGSDDGNASPNCTLPNLQNEQSNSIVSFTACAEPFSEDGKFDNTKPLFFDNKNGYSSSCPTGRISFKLYDWNPAEFPRRLRHQIFEWLASMPVELEGYIRPGCTILTVFIAMPESMWDKLYKESAHLLNGLVNSPSSLLTGRGNFLIYLDNMIFQILRDGTSLMNIRMEVHAPRIHFVHPTFFEVGKPIEFFVCGSYLDQPKFRSLVSFNGKYVKHECSRVSSDGTNSFYVGNGEEYIHNSEHEIFRINITTSEPETCGPAFIEVENVCGLSNFVPILFGSKHLCSELQQIEQKILGKNPHENNLSPSSSDLFTRQTRFSQFLLDIAWLQKKPTADRIIKNELSPANIQRLTLLLKFLISNEFVNMLEIVLRSSENVIGGEVFSNLEKGKHDADMVEFLELVGQARQYLIHRTRHNVRPELDFNNYCKLDESSPLLPSRTLEANEGLDGGLCSTSGEFGEDGEKLLPVTGQVAHRERCGPQLGRTWSITYPAGPTRARFALALMVCAIVCVTACMVLVHPNKTRVVAVSVRRYLFPGLSN